MPPWKDLVPRLVLSAESRSWPDIARDYEQHLAERAKQFGALPEPPANDPGTLWKHVSRSVSEKNVSLLASGLYPNDPVETWKMRNGSQLDRTYLFYRWLKATGTPCRWGWIRPRPKGELSLDAPALTAFSVPAVYVGEDGHGTWRVLGDELAAPEEPVARLCKAPLLAAPGGLDHLPLPAPDCRGKDRSVTVRLEKDGDARLQEKITYRGRSARSLRRWRRLTEREIRNRVRDMVTANTPRP